MDDEVAKAKAEKYAATWETWTLLPAGAGWAFAVGIIKQGGRRRVRVAKGKVRVSEAGELPITQQSKFNLKVADWKLLRKAIDQYIAELEVGPEEKKALDTGNQAPVSEEEGQDE